MPRFMRFAGIVLMVVAAAEFGLLGANAAGLTAHGGSGGDSQDGPGHRATPTAAPGRAPASIQITPDPLAIPCDPSHSVTLTVRLTDAAGRPVADGTGVVFSNFSMAVLDPMVARTVRGVASTRVRPASAPPFDATLMVDVRAGELDVMAKIPCRGACPISPPADSPPCALPTAPVSPPPCAAVSPPAPASPPCPTPTPAPCAPTSPPAGSPPCPTPTPAPCAPGAPPLGSPPCVAPTPPPTDGTGPTLSISANGLAVTLAASGAGFAPYRGFNYSLRYDPAELAFAAVAYHVPPSWFCVSDHTVTPDHAAAGCIILGPTTTTAVGDLATISFAARSAAPGCTVVHIVSYGPPDGGDAGTGTYTLSAASRVQANPYGAVTLWLPLNGGSCAGAPPTRTPTPPATATATP